MPLVVGGIGHTQAQLLPHYNTTIYYDVNAIIGTIKTTVTLTVAYPKSSLELDHPPPPVPWWSSKLIQQVHTAKPYI